MFGPEGLLRNHTDYSLLFLEKTIEYKTTGNEIIYESIGNKPNKEHEAIGRNSIIQTCVFHT